MLDSALRWLFAGMLCLGAATCGQKGPLELPDEYAANGLVPSRADEIPGLRGSGGARGGESDGIRA